MSECFLGFFLRKKNGKFSRFQLRAGENFELPDEINSRFKLIVADRDQNFGGHSKYRSRPFQQKKLK